MIYSYFSYDVIFFFNFSYFLTAFLYSFDLCLFTLGESSDILSDESVKSDDSENSSSASFVLQILRGFLEKSLKIFN